MSTMSLVQSLAPGADEVAILSVVLGQSDGEYVLLRGSLLVAPERAGQVTWRQWQVDHERLTPGPEEPGPEYLVDGPADLTAGRAVISLQAAERVLASLLDGAGTGAIGPLPSFRGTLVPPVALLRLSRHMDTPGSTFIGSAVRPVMGYLLRGSETWPDQVDLGWGADGKMWINPPFALGVALGLTPRVPGLLVGRLERRAWFSALRGTAENSYVCSLGLEQLDISELSITLEEWTDGELLYAHTTNLDEWDLTAVRGAGAVTVSLPSIGGRIERTIRLHDREGTFLDGTVERFRTLGTISTAVGVVGMPSVTTAVIGAPLEPPTLVGAAAAEMQRLHYELKAAGATVTLLDTTADVYDEIRRRLATSKGPMRIVDRYFGGDAASWSIIPAGRVAQVLISKSLPPTTPIPGVDVRRLAGSPPPFHGRAYLWQGGGIAVDNSPNGFGVSPVLVTSLNAAVAARWEAIFATWWATATPV